MFELTGVLHRYGAVTAVEVPEWRAGAGEAWLLAGQSGSGKSTLLHILAGLTTPTVGTVIVNGTDVVALSEGARDRWRGRTVGLVPQRLHLVGALDVRDNLRLAYTLAGLPVDETRITALLEAVGVTELSGRFPSQLSQGQAQRVAIARAVVNRPALLEAGAPPLVESHEARVRPLLPHAFTLPAWNVEAA